MTFSIRPFAEHDYDAYAHMVTVCMTYPVTGATVRRDDEKRDAKYKVGRFIAEAEGRPVGYAAYEQGAWAYHPRKFYVEVCVLPEYRGRGIGSALYNHMVEAMAPLEPISFLTATKENFPDGLRFLEKLRFQEVLRSWESHLDLSTVDLAPHLSALERAEAQGYEIKSYPELAEHPDRDRQLHALMNELRKDVPSAEPVTDIAYEEWIKGFQKPEFWPEGYLVALKDGAMVGVHGLWKNDQPGYLHNGLTAVLREHRGTGLAMAMKLRGIQTAQAAGYANIKTWNESNNQRMLAINIKLGFVRRPAWVQHRLPLLEEALV